MNAEIIVRAAEDRDVDGIVGLVEDRIGEEDAPEARLVLEDPGFDRTRWSVAVDGDRVVSTMATFPMHIRFGSVAIPGSQIEFVATDADYEGRGLVRRQFDYHHADLEHRGELLQVIVGITYFYRRLGYEYALPLADWRTIQPEEITELPDDRVVRLATIDDIETLVRLNAATQQHADVGVAFTPELWHLVLTSPVYRTLIVERAAEAVACGRLYADEEPYVLDLSAQNRDDLAALLSGLAGLVPGKPLTIVDRLGTRPLLADIGSAEKTGDAYYARIGDPVAFLNAVRPELSRRLAASPLASGTGRGLISLYAASIRFDYADGVVGAFEWHPGEPAPISKGGSGVAPDRFTSLLIGPLGFSGLADRYPDVNGGKQAALMATLFPPMRSDVQSWVVP